MRVLVIGGTRFMGPGVVRRLVWRGHAVTVFNRGETPGELPAGVDRIRGDRREFAEHAGALRRAAPDVVLDMFAMTEADARALIEMFAGAAARVVVVSSADVYRAFGRLTGFEPGSPEPDVLSEDSPLRERLYLYRGEMRPATDDPRWWTYDYDKILVERVVMAESSLPGTILRLPMVYGPGDYQHRFFAYIKRMDDGRRVIPLEASLSGWRGHRGYVENVAEAIALAVSDPRATGRIYNVGDPDVPTEAEWVREIGRAAGWDGEIAVVPDGTLGIGPLAFRTAAQDLVMDTSRIRQELGYAEPVRRDEALRQTVAWERSHPPDPLDLRLFDYDAEDSSLARTRGG